MEEHIDIKYFLLKHKNDNVSLSDTFDSILKYVEQNNWYVIDSIKESYELGRIGKELTLIQNSNDKLSEFIINDTIDNFINFISINGFFLITDIESAYNIGKLENNKNIEGNAIADFYIHYFREYLITDYKMM